MRSKVFSTMAVGLALSACAGRDPAPVASVQPQDVYADCTMIRAEIEANNTKIKELADERGWKVTQNVAAGLAGFVVPVIWFGMDWKGAIAPFASERDKPVIPNAGTALLRRLLFFEERFDMAQFSRPFGHIEPIDTATLRSA